MKDSEEPVVDLSALPPEEREKLTLMGLGPPSECLPLRERKKLRTRRALVDAAMRMFLEQGFDAVTVDNLAEKVEVSKSTFFRNFERKETVAIEGETVIWSAYLAVLAGRRISGPVLTELRATMTETVAALPAEWDEHYVATRRLVNSCPVVQAHTAHYRTTVHQRIATCLAGKLGMAPDDMRLAILAETTATAWSVAARTWVYANAEGGRNALLHRLGRAFDAIPESLSLSGTGENRE
ncbi:TetR family transcriptional regulator [Haloactinospora alba]|uniref:TetR family transcriptional regulator n=1 Tax=Haloactinospora alba TaxID=405555 RepID=A0A543N9M0_9ACTN|nr:TetR family transcriptional regulator [Haloactinospora alba]TQN28499.1 TetR family transcriptional regulator [Haloactinospora alba]